MLGLQRIYSGIVNHCMNLSSGAHLQGIVVKIMTKKLGEKYYKKKGTIKVWTWNTVRYSLISTNDIYGLNASLRGRSYRLHPESTGSIGHMTTSYNASTSKNRQTNKQARGNYLYRKPDSHRAAIFCFRRRRLSFNNIKNFVTLFDCSQPSCFYRRTLRIYL